MYLEWCCSVCSFCRFRVISTLEWVRQMSQGQSSRFPSWDMASRSKLDWGYTSASIAAPLSFRNGIHINSLFNLACAVCGLLMAMIPTLYNLFVHPTCRTNQAIVSPSPPPKWAWLATKWSAQLWLDWLPKCAAAWAHKRCCSPQHTRIRHPADIWRRFCLQFLSRASIAACSTGS